MTPTHGNDGPSQQAPGAGPAHPGQPSQPAQHAPAGQTPPSGQPAPPPGPRPGAPRSTSPADAGAGWSQTPPPRAQPTSVLPGGSGAEPGRRPGSGRPASPRPAGRGDGRTATRPVVGRSRRARLALRRIDPWSVFLFSLIASVFLGIALVVAVAILYAILGSLGVTESLNELFAEVTGGSPTTGALLTSGRIVGGAAVLAAVNVVFLTLLATLSALLYNLCASFTGGIEVTLGERD